LGEKKAENTFSALRLQKNSFFAAEKSGGLRDTYKGKKKSKLILPPIIIQGIVHITTTLNNTFLTFTDKKGNVRIHTTAGACGFKGSRRSTRHAAQMAGIALGKKCARIGISKVLVKIKGLGYGKQSSIKGLYKGGLRILRLQDVTSIPFNGCRPPQKRRIKKRKGKRK